MSKVFEVLPNHLPQSFEYEIVFTENSIISFLATMGSHTKQKVSQLGRKIPASQSRKKPTVLAGEKTAHNCKKQGRKKRPRNLNYCISKNMPSAKSHGKGH